MRKTRAEIDEIAWRILEDRVPCLGPPPGYLASPRPANYIELAALIADQGDFELAWGEFLHESYRFKCASFFAVPPPNSFRNEHRAWLAGVAE